MPLLAFRAHVTTAAGTSVRLGVLASGQHHASELLNLALPDARGAQLRCIRPLLADDARPVTYPTGSRYRAPAANSARLDSITLETRP